MSVLLTRRAVVQTAIEDTYGVTADVGLNDGVLVSKPTFTVTPNILERDFTRDTLSQQAHIVGRLLAKMEFETELRSNGNSNSGLPSSAPIIARLFRACGYVLTGNAAPSLIGPFTIGAALNDIAWTPDVSTATNTDMIAYFLQVTTGGPSGTAMITVSSDTAGESAAAALVTAGTAIPIGTKGLTLTPAFAGTLITGTRWVVWLTPSGVQLRPISNNFESASLVMYKDGVKHTMPGSFGTFEITAAAGTFGSIKWTFTGIYKAPVDQVMPSPVYEKTLPAQVELGRLRLDTFSAVVEKFTFNQKNDIQIRPDVSSSQGYIGTRIVSRKPEGGVNPEADTVANYDFWGIFAAATRIPFQMRVGTTPGNTVWMIAPAAQYTGMTYTDRQGIMAYDAGLTFPGYQADDEFFLYFA